MTVLVVLYGKGYRFGLSNGAPALSGTGLLVTTSNPDGAQVFVNGHLTTATDNTINLAPGNYDVKIYKEGYFPWEKQLVVKKEVVTKADALLLPTAPKLESITNTGISNPVIDPSLTKLAFNVASQSAVKNGIYVLDMSSRPILTFQASSNQIADDTSFPFSKATLSWSPDGSQILASISGQSMFLLAANGMNSNPTDVTETLSATTALWNKQKTDKQKAQNEALPKTLRSIVSNDFNILQWSEDETKILYEASNDTTLPPIITPALIGTDSTPEERTLSKGAVYVYDIKEDKNFKILDKLPEGTPSPIMFFPDSTHLVYVHNGKIDMMEYDAQNQTTVYAGPFVNDYVFPWPDGSKLVILTNLGNPNILPNLYTISLK